MYYIRLLEGSNEITSLGVHGFRLPNWYFVTLTAEEASGVSDFDSLVISATGAELTPPGMINLDVNGEVIGQGLLVFLDYIPNIIPSPYSRTTSFGLPAVVGAEYIFPNSFTATTTFGSPSVTSDYQVILPNSLTNSSLTNYGLPAMIGEAQTIIASGFENTSTFGEPSIIESRHLSIPYVPRWMEPAYPVGSNIARLVHSIIIKPSVWTLQPIQDSSVSIYGRTDMDDSYWRIPWDSDIDTVLLDGSPIPYVKSMGDGLYYPRAAWTRQGNTVVVFWGDLETQFITVSDWSDIEALLPNGYTGRVYAVDPNNQIYYFDSTKTNTLPAGGYRISWRGNPRTVTINNQVVTPITTKAIDRWDELADYWKLDKTLSNFELRGKLQATQSLSSVRSKIAASLFGMDAFWWTGQSDLVASGETEYDFPLEKLDIVNETLHYLSPTEYLTSQTPVDIEVLYLGEVLDPATDYSVSSNVVTFTFVPTTPPTVRYTIQQMVSKGDLVRGADGLRDRYYPVFEVQSTTLQTQAIKREKFVWNKIRLKNSTQSTFL